MSKKQAPPKAGPVDRFYELGVVAPHCNWRLCTTEVVQRYVGQALHLGRHGIDIVPVYRDDAAILVVNLLLKRVVHFLTFGRIGYTADFDQNLVEFWILVIGLVPGRIGLECNVIIRFAVGRMFHDTTHIGAFSHTAPQ